MINKTLIFLSLAFIFVFASCSEKPCTDDGCPEFNELEVPTRFLPCLTSGLAYYNSVKKAPDRKPLLKQLYDIDESTKGGF